MVSRILTRRTAASGPLLALALLLPLVAYAAEQEHYTLFVELRQPYESNRAALQKMLKAEGYEFFSEREEEIALVLTSAQIGKLFRGKVRQRTVEASAKSGTVTQPSLEGARIPARFEKLMQRVYFDPQRS